MRLIGIASARFLASMYELLAFPASYPNRDMEVADMISRYAGSILGLFAFTVTVFAGLIVGNPVLITLQRSVFALLVFCVLGLVLGWAAQLVVREYARSREAEIAKRYPLDSDDTDVVTGEASGTMPDAGLTGT